MIEVGSYYEYVNGDVYKVLSVNLEQSLVVITHHYTYYPFPISFEAAMQDFVKLTPLEVELL